MKYSPYGRRTEFWHSQPTHRDPRSVRLLSELRGLLPQPDQIEHSAPVFLIDPFRGDACDLPEDFTPDTLVSDLKVLVTGG